MRKPSENEQRQQLRDKIIGLGERSVRKSYYPELQKRVEELERKNEELRRQISIRQQAEKTKEELEIQLRQALKMEAIGTLAGGIAHDFNNLLTVIIGHADLSQVYAQRCHAAEDCQVTESMHRILEAGYRARELVRHILTFSRQQEHEKTPLRLSEVVVEALNLMRASLPKSITISQNIEDAGALVMADPTQIHQIMMNLCTNSHHAMQGDKGTINVNTYTSELRENDLIADKLVLSPGKYSVMEIQDDGSGMEADVVGRIFDPYFTTKGENIGTGMGLSVVHGIVREHGGYISVTSEPQKGSIFKIFLPQIDASLLPHALEDKREVPRGSESILVIDDEQGVLDLEKQLLQGLGYSVTTCSDPLRVMGVLQASDGFDLVLTDMTMPGQNGAEVTRQILAQNPEMAVVICSGFSELMDEEKAKAIGAKHFVMKPLARHELATILRTVLDGKGSKDQG